MKLKIEKKSTLWFILRSISHFNGINGEIYFFTVLLWMQLVVWRLTADMIKDQIGSLVVTQVPCSYMTSQSDLLIRLTISCPNTHKGQINTAGLDWLQWAGRWRRWADLKCCSGVNVIEISLRKKAATFPGCCLLLWWISMYIENVMCKQVNIQYGYSLYFSLHWHSEVHDSVSSTD